MTETEVSIAAKQVECFKCHGSGKTTPGQGARLDKQIIVKAPYPSQAEFHKDGIGYMRTYFGDVCIWCSGLGYRIEQDGKEYAPEQICGHPMYSDFAHRKRDRVCVMDAGHRGRHASFGVFHCEGCGKSNRGTPISVSDGDGGTMKFCFMCASPQMNNDYYPR